MAFFPRGFPEDIGTNCFPTLVFERVAKEDWKRAELGVGGPPFPTFDSWEEVEDELY